MTAALVLRSLLFVPGTRPDRFGKALATAADMVAIDLEDAVARGDKDSARRSAVEHIGSAPEPARERLALRINALSTPEGIADLCAMADRGPGTILLAKTESVRDVEIVAGALGAGCRLMPLIETVRGLDAAQEIAAHPAVGALMFGGADFAAEIGAGLEWEALYAARARMVMAGGAARIPVIDVPHIVLDDEAGLAQAAGRARAMGFAGKACIHPSQIVPVNAAFSPSVEELERARKVVAAYRKTGLGRLDGELVEAPLVKCYERMLKLAERLSDAGSSAAMSG